MQFDIASFVEMNFSEFVEDGLSCGKEDQVETVELPVFPCHSRLFPGLPPLLAPAKPIHSGPTSESNWVIQNKWIAGAYPGSLNREEAIRKANLLADLGVTTFVSLLQEDEA